MSLFKLTLILVFQLVGELIKHLFSLPLPGAIVGMLLFLLYLSLTPADPKMTATCQKLISFLPLFFIPAGVGVLNHVAELKLYGLALGLSLVAGTIAGFMISILILKKLLKKA
jgi:holin-like protein